MDEEDAQRKRESEAVGRDEDDEEVAESVQTNDNDRKPGKKKAKKRKLKRNSSVTLSSKRKRLMNGTGSIESEFARRVFEMMEKTKENFFVIQLYPESKVPSLLPIKDLDPLLNSELMECRDVFLERSREKHLEFSTLRRAKYSTLVMLYELHNESRQSLIYTCNVCNVQLATRWHCEKCVEYDLCPRCYETEKHPHAMSQIDFGADDCSRGNSSNEAVQESDRDKVSRLVKALSHSCSCRDANCRVYSCKNMKNSVKHFQMHSSSSRNECSTCSCCLLLSRLCLYHSKTCREAKCPVPLCPQLKAKLKQQQKQQRLKQTQMLRRRMATMQRSNNLTPNHQPTPPPQPYQQFSQPSSVSECVSSPVPTSMQSSPFASTATTSVSFSIASPLSRNQTVPFMHTSGPTVSAYSNQPNAHPQAHSRACPSPPISSSPSITSPVCSNLPPSSCPFGYTSHTGSMNGSEPAVLPTYDNGSIPAHSYQFQRKIPPTSSFTCVPTGSPYQGVRQHQLDRDPSSQLGSDNFGSTQAVYHLNNVHHPLTGTRLHPPIRQGPDSLSSQQLSAPSSPRSQQYYTAQGATTQNVSTCPNISSYVQPSSIHQRSQLDDQQTPYGYPKQYQQQSSNPNRHQLQPCPQLNDAHSNVVAQMHQLQSGSAVSSLSWRGGTQSSAVSPAAGMCNSGPSRCGSPLQPNVTIARNLPVPTSLPNNNNCTTPPMISISVSSDDICLVQQTYNTMRQRGTLASEFPKWLNSNPHLFKAWQFIQQQQQHAFNQQQRQQAQHSVQPFTHQLSNSFPNHSNIVPPQAVSNYSGMQTPQHLLQSGSVARSIPQSRHLMQPQQQLQQSVISCQSQPWNPGPHQQQPRYRSVGHLHMGPSHPQQAVQHQMSGPYYQNSAKLTGSSPAAALQLPRYPSPVHMQHSVHSQQPSGQPTLPSSMIGLPRGGGMVPPGIQQQQPMARYGAANSSIIGAANCMMGGTGRSAATPAAAPQTPPQYSVMLSQLLGPGQMPNHMPTSQEFMMGPNGQPIQRQEFSPSVSNMFPVNQPYPEGGI